MAKAKVTMPEITIEQPGFIYIFVYNRSDSPNWVFFDELLVTHEHSTVVAGADYYPFGLPMDGREITDEPYRWGYQGQYAQKNDTTGWNEFQLRMYDARFGRWLNPDPYRQFWSPYLAMGNAPHMNVDPNGGVCCSWTELLALADQYAVTATRITSTAATTMLSTTAAAIARGSGGYEIEFNLNVPTGTLGNVDSYQPTDAQLNRWNSPPVDTSIPRPDTSPFLTSEPGFAESLIPVWGSGRQAAAAFSRGNYWTGLGHTALAISDVFLVKAIATAGVKLLVKGAAKGGLNLFKYGSQQATKSTGWRTGDRFLHLPNRGTPKLNWAQNSGALRQEMRLSNPIFDSYRLPNGNLIPTGGFLNAERNLLRVHGWIYNPRIGAWMPPF